MVIALQGFGGWKGSVIGVRIVNEDYRFDSCPFHYTLTDKELCLSDFNLINMSLNWNLQQVENYEQFYDEQKDGLFSLNRVAHTIIFHCMSIGISEISEKNWEQFYDRVNMWEKIKGTTYLDSETRKPLYITKEDVKSMIGLKTNVSDFSKNEFLKRLSYGFNI